MKRIICMSAILLAAAAQHRGMAAVLYSQGFNSPTIPADWATELVTNISAPAVTFVTASMYPAGFAPYEGTHFVRFNSFSCSAGASIRLKRTASLSLVGLTNVVVQFAWTRDTDWAGYADRVIVQYSTNGTTWIDAGTYQRPGAANYWEVNSCTLPPGATNQAAVYIAFQFVSAFGSDCHLDDVTVQNVNSAPPMAFTATGVSTARIDLAWVTNTAGQTVIIASNSVNSFGLPADGTAYNAGSALSGGGGIIYKGTGTVFANAGLLPGTMYYYRAWSVNAATQYSIGVSASAKTHPAPIGAFPYFESFETGWGVWLPSLSNNFNWARIQGPPPTAGTGPSQAQDGSWYAYTESSSPNNPNKMAGLFASFNFAGMAYPQLSFYYHMYGANIGTLAVDIFDGAWHTNVWSLTGQQQTSATDAWRRADVPLTAYAFSNVLVQFRGVTGSGALGDVGLDTIRVFNKPPNVYLDPAAQNGVGTPGATVQYALTIENATPASRVFVFTYPSAWPVSGPAATSTAIPAGGTTALVVSVQIPADAVAGVVCTSTVRALAADNLYSNTALLITRCTWTYDILSEPFTVWPHGWDSYGTSGTTPWYQDVGIGMPAPCAAHAQDPVTGGVSWLVSPPINLAITGPESLPLSFYFAALGAITNEGVYISTGNRDPVAGDYRKLSDYAYLIGGWVFNQLDLIAYKGNNPVYLAFRYTGLNPQQFVDTISITGQKIGLGTAWLKAPPAFAITSYQASPSVTGMLCIAGETGAAGPAPNTTAQFGYGPTGTAPGSSWNWVDAPYIGASGSNDLFATAAFITVAGMQDYAFRFRRGDAAWVYADLDGSTNGYSSAQAGKATVALLPPQGSLLINQPIPSAVAIAVVSYVYPTNMALNYNEVADDLTLPYDAYIKSLRWAGAYAGDGRKGLECGFWLRIYAEANGVPGTLLYQEFKPGYACEQMLGAAAGYNYHSDLATPFRVNAGQRYWLSIQDEVVTNTTWSLALITAPRRGSNVLARTGTAAAWSSIGAADIAVEVYGSATNAGVIAGTVTAAHSGAPIAGVGVRATNSVLDVATTTGTNGIYVLMLPAGTYTLLATAPNYVTGVAAGVPVANAGATVRDFSLTGSVLSYGPGAITARMQFGERVTNTIYVTNSGPLAVTYFAGIGNLSAVTNLGTRVASSPVHLPPSDGLFEHTPATLGCDPLQAPAAKNDLLARRAADAYPSVLSYGFINLNSTPNRLVSFMTGAPGILLTNLPAAGAVGDFVTGADFMGDDLNKLYCITIGSGAFFSLQVANAATNLIAVVPPVSGQSWTGMAASPDGRLFVCSSSITISKLFTINPFTGALTFIGDISNGPGIADIAVSPGGVMYGLDIVADNLVRIDTATGAGTIIGSVGFNANGAQDMDFDNANNILYLASAGAGNQLRVADVTTGNTTNLGALVAQTDGFAVATPLSPSWASLSTNTGMLAAGGATTFAVMFDAGMVSNGGVYRADLIFSGNYVNSPPALPLTMIIATAPIISAPASLHFADTVIDSARTQALVVANIGIGVLTGAVSGVSAPFGLSGANSYLIPAGTNVQLTAFFAPLTEGAYTNAIALSGGGGATVTMTGNGVPEPAVLLVSAALFGIFAKRKRNAAWMVGLLALVQFSGMSGYALLSDRGLDPIRALDPMTNVYLTPGLQSGLGTPGSAVQYTLTVENATPAARVFVFNYPSVWPVSGPAATMAAIPSGGTTTLVVSVQVPADAVAGAVCTSTVRAIAADNLYSNTALLLTRCTWTYDLLYEPFDAWPHGWTNYSTSGTAPWYQYPSSGQPPPCARHDQDAVTGSVSWLVSPPLNLAVPGVERLLLSFYFLAYGDITNEGIYISTGNRDPVAGDYRKLGDFANAMYSWTLNQLDLMPYKGNTPVYLAFRYVGVNPIQFVDTITVAGYKIGLGDGWLISPPAFSITSYQSSPVITGALFIAGETGAAGPASNITAQFGYGPTSTVPGSSWVWINAPYAGAAGSNDLFATSAIITVAGMQDYAFRFRRGDATWVYADLDGSSNGYRSAQAGKAAVAMLPPQGGLLINRTVLPYSGAAVSYTVPTNMAPDCYEVADDLTLPYDAYIKSLRWAGFYAGDGRKGLERGFWLRIYAESNSVPGTLLYQEFKPGYACEQVLNTTWNQYHGDLATPFRINAGQRYWFSVQHEVVTNTVWYLAMATAPITGSNALLRAGTLPWTGVGQADIAVEVYGSATNAGVIAGTVSAAHSGAPIAGAGIRATNSASDVATTSGANGAYALTLPAGVYTLFATAPNYATGVAAGVTVATASTTVQNFALSGSLLTYGPSAISARMSFGERVTNVVYVTNSGPLAVSYLASIGNVGALTNLAKRVAAFPVHLPPSDGLFEHTPATSGLAPMAPLAAAGSPPGVRTARAYPSVLGYGFNIAPTPNRFVSLMTSAPGTLLSDTPAAGVPSDFVTGADFLGNDLSKLYCITYSSGKFFSLQVGNATTTMIATVPPVGNWTGMAASPNGTLYVCSYDGAKSSLFTINPVNGALTSIGVISNANLIIDIAVSAGGVMYGLDIVSDTLLKIDTTNGVGTIIGSIGFDASFAQDMDFDYANNILYLAAYNFSGGPQLRAADITTGNSFSLGALGVAQMDGFAVAKLIAPPWASPATSTGTVAAGAAATFNVVFNAGSVANGGVYNAELVFSGNYVNSPPALPLTMIIATAPIISAPASLHFADTLIGDARTQALTVANIGIGVLTGAVSGVSAPFGVASSTAYTISAGTNTVINTFFAPAVEGSFTNVVTLSGGGGKTVTLTGAGVPEPCVLLGVAVASLCLLKRHARRST